VTEGIPPLADGKEGVKLSSIRIGERALDQCHKPQEGITEPMAAKLVYVSTKGVYSGKKTSGDTWVPRMPQVRRTHVEGRQGKGTVNPNSLLPKSEINPPNRGYEKG